ncbi:hypothetical protein lerEdw1_013957, partial [Lerista edwardsae]
QRFGASRKLSKGVYTTFCLLPAELLYLALICFQQRKVSPKPMPKVHRRDAEGFPDIHETEGDTNDIEIKLKVPFEIGMKISEEQYKDYGQILEQFLEDIFAEDNKENKATH